MQNHNTLMYCGVQSATICVEEIFKYTQTEYCHDQYRIINTLHRKKPEAHENTTQVL